MRLARTLLRLALLLSAGGAVATACGGKTAIPGSDGRPVPSSGSGSTSSTSSGGTQAGCPAMWPNQYSQCSDVGLVCPYSNGETCSCENPGTWFCTIGVGDSSSSGSSSGGPSSNGSSTSSGGGSSVISYCPGLDACPPIAGCNSVVTCTGVDGCNTCQCSGSEWGCTDAACPNPACPPQASPGAPCLNENQLCTWADTQCACVDGSWTCIPACPQPASCPASEPAQYGPCYSIGLSCPYANSCSGDSGAVCVMTCTCGGPGTWFCTAGGWLDGG